jgi:hypothetical protein
MLIWYADLPEEATYYVRRHAGGWEPLAVANVLLNFAVPFTLLLSRYGKRRETWLLRVAVVVLVGRWLDLYLSVAPPVRGPEPKFGLAEIGLLVGACGAFLWSVRRSLARPRSTAVA